MVQKTQKSCEVPVNERRLAVLSPACNYCVSKTFFVHVLHSSGDDSWWFFPLAFGNRKETATIFNAGWTKSPSQNRPYPTYIAKAFLRHPNTFAVVIPSQTVVADVRTTSPAQRSTGSLGVIPLGLARFDRLLRARLVVSGEIRDGISKSIVETKNTKDADGLKMRIGQNCKYIFWMKTRLVTVKWPKRDFHILTSLTSSHSTITSLCKFLRILASSLLIG